MLNADDYADFREDYRRACETEESEREYWVGSKEWEYQRRMEISLLLAVRGNRTPQKQQSCPFEYVAPVAK